MHERARSRPRRHDTESYPLDSEMTQIPSNAIGRVAVKGRIHHIRSGVGASDAGPLQHILRIKIEYNPSVLLPR